MVIMTATNAMVYFDLSPLLLKNRKESWHQETQHRCHSCQPFSILSVKRGAHFSPLQCPSSAVMGIQPPCKHVLLQQSVIITFPLLNCRVSSSTEQTERQKITFNPDSIALIMSGVKASSTYYACNTKV